MKKPSFRLKIALLSMIISGLVMLGFGVLGYLMIARQKTESLDTAIRSLGVRHPGWIANRRDFQRLDESLGSIFGDNHGDQAILLVKDAAGTVLHTSPGWPADLDPAKFDIPLKDDPKALSEDRGDGGFRGGRGWGGQGRGMGPGGGQASFTKIPHFLTDNTAAGGWRIGMLGTADTTMVIGLNTRQSRAELDRLRNQFLFALPLALSLVALGGWIVAGRALKPMQAIARTAEQVTARGLDQRIPLSDEDPEITRVIQVLNRMMDRLENSFQQATRFSADASHELRTPLAIMQGELENALHEALPGSREQQVFNGLLEETQRLKTITSGLLLLARADAGQLKPALKPVELTSLLDDMIEDARALADESRIEFIVKSAPGVLILADPVLLRTALMNLFVNAVKYNEAGGRIEVELESRDGKAVLSIGNSGPGIPAADQTRIFTRFHRVDASRERKVEGFGLGLSLASEIIRAHGGDLRLAESRPGWTRFQLEIATQGGIH